ncbi:MAG: alanine racemase [Hydrogenophilus sp.]|nr:alanine racemase [Hydrogenophilus sp.]
MRPTVAEIDLNALLANYRLLRARAMPGRAFAVIKADAYGHGARAIARTLAPHVDGFAVAFLEEALLLREERIEVPILLLEGAFSPHDYDPIAAFRLWPVIHHPAQLAWLAERLAAGKPLPQRLFLFLDSGMHREGLLAPTLSSLAERLALLGYHREQIIWTTHLACADEPNHPHTRAQLTLFRTLLATLPPAWKPPLTSIANSAALLSWPEAASDWARPGIALFGISPFPLSSPLSSPPPSLQQPISPLGLLPVMRLTSRIVSCRSLPAGEAVGYGATFIADRPMRIGLVPIGYADGYPRTAPTGTPVSVSGWRTRLIGRVSMDLITIDLTDLPPSIAEGAEVELWGPTLSISEIAAASGTIPYELLTRLKRVPYRLLPLSSPS